MLFEKREGNLQVEIVDCLRRSEGGRPFWMLRRALSVRDKDLLDALRGLMEQGVVRKYAARALSSNGKQYRRMPVYQLLADLPTPVTPPQPTQALSTSPVPRDRMAFEWLIGPASRDELGI